MVVDWGWRGGKLGVTAKRCGGAFWSDENIL